MPVSSRGRYSSPRLSIMRSEGPRMRRSRETGTMASPIEETERALTGSPAAPLTALRIDFLTRSHTSVGSSSDQPGRGRRMSYSSYANESGCPVSENTAALQPVVPTSMPRRLIRLYHFPGSKLSSHKARIRGVREYAFRANAELRGVPCKVSRRQIHGIPWRGLLWTFAAGACTMAQKGRP